MQNVWANVRSWSLLAIILFALIGCGESTPARSASNGDDATVEGQQPQPSDANQITPVANTVAISDDGKQANGPETNATTSGGKEASPATTDEETLAVEEPWDYSPYRVRIWIASDRADLGAKQLAGPLSQILDRSFSSVWRTNISDAPVSIRASAGRDFRSLNYETLTSVDPVIAVKRDHPEAPRIRFAQDVASYVKSCLTTSDRLDELKRRAQTIGNPTLDGVMNVMRAAEGDSLAVSDKWNEEGTEALVLSRGMAAKLRKPEAKIIRLPVDDLVAEEITANDKIFIVHINTTTLPMRVRAIEVDCLMRHVSRPCLVEATDESMLPMAVGEAVIQSFAPLVRIEDAGAKNAVGLIRASGLLLTDQHPAMVQENEFLQPFLRKDDRNGNPTLVGTIPWAFLHVKKRTGGRVEMDLYAGRQGGLQGRKNNRTFRMAMRTRPFGENSVIRLHAAGRPDEPLAGYEVYEKELDSIDMTLVGRTDWDGRIIVDKADAGMRLLYVKNGGAILARLPIVPGLTDLEIADLTGDDQRLRAEAYIRGVQNSIIDLIAIRTLLAARIRMRLEKGQMDEAKELFQALRDQPTYNTIADDMGKKAIALRARNTTEQRKIDMLFAQTREMLVKNINDKIIRDLELDIAAAAANGGVLKKADANAAAASNPTTPAAPTPAAVEPASQPASPEANPAANDGGSAAPAA